MPDLKLTDELDLQVPTEIVTGAELAAQKIRVRLSTWQTGWFLDESAGIPYGDWFLDKAPPMDEIREVVRDEITAVDGVQRIAEFDVSQNGETINISGRIVFSENEQSGELTFDIAPTGEGNTHPYLTILDH